MRGWRTLARYAGALGSVALVTFFIGLVLGRTQVGNISMLYLAAVLGSAMYLGRGPASLAALASIASFNWFFVEPVHTVTVADPSDLLSLLVFLLTAIVTGQLAADQRSRAEQARAREREAVVLYDVVRLMAEFQLDDALRAVADRLRQELGLDGVAIEVASPDGMPRRTAVGSDAGLRALEQPTLSARQVLGASHPPTAEKAASAGRWVRVMPPSGITRTDAGERLHAVPLSVGARRGGLLLLLRARGSSTFSSSETRLISAAAGQLSLAIERAELRQQATQSEVLRAADQAKSALLQAVSHDLRTPLSSIIAGATSLRQRDVIWSDEERDEFLTAIEAEARRLDRIVGNLLSVSRIESGTLRPNRDWHDMGSAVDDVVQRVRSRNPTHRIVLAIADGIAPTRIDPVQIDQALTNVLENAINHTPEGGDVSVEVRQQGQAIEVRVSDRGPGVPAGAAHRIFEPFERAHAGTAPTGTGLGLAVAKRFVEAHGGRIWLEPRQGGGSTFAFTVPISE